MPTRNFKRDFKPRILSGEKGHTIRDPKNPAKPGQTMFMQCGPRYKPERFAERTILSVYPIELQLYNPEPKAFLLAAHIGIKVGDLELSTEQISRFIRNDGFSKSPDFFEFFFKEELRTQKRATRVMFLESWQVYDYAPAQIELP